MRIDRSQSERVNSLPQLDAEGFALLPAVLGAVEIERLLAAMERYDPEGRAGRRGGLRHVVSRVSEIAAIAHSPKVRALAEAALGAEPILARSL